MPYPFSVSLFRSSPKLHVYVSLMHNHKMLSHAPRRPRRPPTCAVSIQFFGQKKRRIVANVRDICSMQSRTRFWWLLSSFQLTFARFTDRYQNERKRESQQESARVCALLSLRLSFSFTLSLPLSLSNSLSHSVASAQQRIVHM